MPQYILGLSGFYHDAAAALLADGRVVAAVSEERLSRTKNDPRLPVRAMRWCLESRDITAAELAGVAYYEKPIVKLERAMDTAMATAPKGVGRFLDGVPRWMRDDGQIRSWVRRAIDWQGPLHFLAHHQSHAAAAFFPSPFEEAAILTCDGVGEWDTATLGAGIGNRLQTHVGLRFPHSLGLLYSSFTEYLGFKVNDGEYKVMGLAPYGRPIHAQRIQRDLVHIHDDGSFRLNLDAFEYLWGTRSAGARFAELFGLPRRASDQPLTQAHMDLASSIQAVCETILLRQAHTALDRAGSRNLCMAGGVALNSVANGRIGRELDLDGLWIQPAAGDAGSALGAALGLWHLVMGQPRTPVQPDGMSRALLGPILEDHAVADAVARHGLRMEDVGDGAIERAAEVLAGGGVLAWARGPAEFGPRALGCRSILADPRDVAMKDRVNARVKFREPFRPFAPMVLEDVAGNYFDMTGPHPYMQRVVPVVKSAREGLAAITHVDGSARVQTVDGDHPIAPVVRAFHARTGCPVLLNTSFNLRGQPIVCSAEEAVDTFAACDLDALVVGRWWVTRAKGDTTLTPLPEPPPPPALAPRWNRPSWVVALERPLRPIADAVIHWQSLAMLVVLYGAVLLPTALLRRLVRDPLDRSWPSDGSSGWTPVEADGGPTRMF